jgi:hypothetical protein
MVDFPGDWVAEWSVLSRDAGEKGGEPRKCRINRMIRMNGSWRTANGQREQVVYRRMAL